MVGGMDKMAFHGVLSRVPFVASCVVQSALRALGDGASIRYTRYLKILAPFGSEWARSRDSTHGAQVPDETRMVSTFPVAGVSGLRRSFFGRPSGNDGDRLRVLNSRRPQRLPDEKVSLDEMPDRLTDRKDREGTVQLAEPGQWALRETAFLSNLSQGGLFVRTTEPKPVGSLLFFKMKVNEIEARGYAEVRWCRGYEGKGIYPGMGLKFLEVDEVSRSAIDQMLDSGEFNEARDSIEPPNLPVDESPLMALMRESIEGEPSIGLEIPEKVPRRRVRRWPVYSGILFLMILGVGASYLFVTDTVGGDDLSQTVLEETSFEGAEILEIETKWDLKGTVSPDRQAEDGSTSGEPDSAMLEEPAASEVEEGSTVNSLSHSAYETLLSLDWTTESSGTEVILRLDGSVVDIRTHRFWDTHSKYVIYLTQARSIYHPFFNKVSSNELDQVRVGWQGKGGLHVVFDLTDPRVKVKTLVEGSSIRVKLSLGQDGDAKDPN